MARRHLALADLEIDDLADLGSSVDDVLCEVFKIDIRRAVLALERRMSATLTFAWKGAARDALTSALASLVTGPFTTSRINAFLASLGLKLRKPVTKKQEKVVESRVRSIYSLSKKEAVRQAKGRFVFGAPDARAIAATNRQQIFWVNNFYSEHLSKRISAVSKDVLLEQGLSHREAGRELMKALHREMGLSPGVAPSAFASSVPARYAGNPEFYFQQVASVAGHQGRVFGRIRGFGDAGVITFELVNPMDERTGQICTHMHGQVFTVDAGLSRMDDIVSAKTPDAVREAAPWPTPKALQDALGDAKPGSREATGKLLGLDAVLPPFHPLCRTEPVIHS